MSYIRNYIIIALCLYGVCIIKYFLQVNISWKSWNKIKTTNLFILYCVERLYARTKRAVLSTPIISTDIRYIEDVSGKIQEYGLTRDKLYYVITTVFYNLKNIFGISKNIKRNYLSIILTLLFTKRLWVMRGLVKAYNMRGQYKLKAILYKTYHFVKAVNPATIKKALVGGVIIVLCIIVIKELPILWNKYIKKSTRDKKNISVDKQKSILETLNILQNKLGDYIILLVNQIRAVDRLLAEEKLEVFKKVKAQVVEDIQGYKETVEEIKCKIAETEQAKNIQIYGRYNIKYSTYILALNELSKEMNSEAVLKGLIGQEDKRMAADRNEILEARKILYDYLKKSIEYYDELDAYLTKASKGLKRGKKKIYHREQMVTMQGATEVIEGYFG